MKFLKNLWFWLFENPRYVVPDPWYSFKHVTEIKGPCNFRKLFTLVMIGTTVFLIVKKLLILSDFSKNGIAGSVVVISIGMLFWWFFGLSPFYPDR